MWREPELGMEGCIQCTQTILPPPPVDFLRGPKEHRLTTAGLGRGGGESSKWLLFLSKGGP